MADTDTSTTNAVDPQDVIKRLQLHKALFGNPLSNIGGGGEVAQTPIQVAPQPTPQEQDLTGLRAAMSAREPEKSDYHPGVGRRILGGILGGLAGIHNPKEGYELSSNFVNKDYNKAESEYQKKIAQSQGLVNLDTSQEQEKTKEEEGKARIGAESARAGAEKAREDLYNYRIKNPNDKTKDTIINPKDYVTIKLKDGTKTQAIQRGDKWIGVNGTQIDNNAVDSIEEEKKTPAGNPLTQLYENQAIKELTAKYGDVDHIPLQELQKVITNMSPQGGELGASRAGEMQALEQYYNTRKQLEQADIMSPDDIEHAKGVLEKNPRAISTYSPDQVKQLIKAGVTVPRKIDTAESSKLDAAEITLKKINTIRKALEDPRIKANIGVIAGNLGRASNFIGTDLFNGDKETQRAAQKLRSDLGYLMLNEATLFKNSPSAQLLKRISEMTPQARYDPSLFEGALSSAEENAGATKNQIYNAMGVEAPGEKKTEDKVEYVPMSIKGKTYKVKKSDVEKYKKAGYTDASNK